MYKFAQQVVRHKVGVVAVVAFAVFVFSGKKEEAPQAANPWARQEAPAMFAQEDEGISGKLGNVAMKAGDFVAEKALGDKDLNPIKMGKETVDRFDHTASAMKGTGN